MLEEEEKELLLLEQGYVPDTCKAVRMWVYPGKANPYISDNRHYYHALVFNHRQHMRAYAIRASVYRKDTDTQYDAITVPSCRERFIAAQNQWVKMPKIGVVLFHKDRLGGSVISHESVHMAANYLRLLNQLNLGEENDDNEEKLAYCVGSCTRQIVDTWYDVDGFKSRGRNWRRVKVPLSPIKGGIK